MKHRFLAASIIVSILLPPMLLPMLSSCGFHGLHAYSKTYLDETFDTVLTVTVGAETAAEADAHFDAIKSIVSDLHRRFDAYQTYPELNNIATINASQTGIPVSVCDDVMALLMLGYEVYGQTNGTVHIGLGAVTGLWKDAIDTQTLPSPEQVSEALATAPDLSGMMLDEAHMTVTLMNPGMKLDVGAIAKGYVLAQLHAYATEAGIESLLCNLGGEILAVGSAPNGAAWEIAIANPDGGFLQTVSVTDAVIATGGDYERGFVLNGQRYHHVIDPVTGYPAGEHRAATVLVPLELAMLSDAYSTAMMILPTSRAEELAKAVTGMEYLLVNSDRTQKTSAGWNEKMP